MKIFFAFVFIIVIASSCQKVIDVHLNNAAPQYVIEGNINDSAGPYNVVLSRTKDFSGDNNFDRISGASVMITDSTAGTTETLHETTAGTYQTATTKGIPGHTYHLNVTINGQTFFASSAMPSRAVALDTLYAAPSNIGGSNLFMVPVFTDPAGKGNYYIIRQWVNGQQIKSTAVISDQVADGQTYAFQLHYDTEDGSGNPKIKRGDTISAELQCVNRQVYDYYRTLQAVTGASNVATPTNPITNITGGALGIFNTSTTRRRTTIVR